MSEKEFCDHPGCRNHVTHPCENCGRIGGMEVDPSIKEWIDNADYYTLLHRWRFAKLGDEFFQGSNGLYYAHVMGKKKNTLPVQDQVAISKQVGW